MAIARLALAVVALGVAVRPSTLAAQAAVREVSASPAARAADVASVDAVLAALYGVLSGPAGQTRDWDRFRSLFAPGARLIPSGRQPDGTGSMRPTDVEGFIATTDPVLRLTGLFQREVARRAERFGGVAHAFSTYESRRTLADAKPFARGINSIQLWNDGQRWWVVTVFWEGERPDNQIPAQYLTTPK